MNGRFCLDTIYNPLCADDVCLMASNEHFFIVLVNALNNMPGKFMGKGQTLFG